MIQKKNSHEKLISK